MRYAIIAAGEGSRLANEGVAKPKPLVEIKGECLIDRLLRIFMDNGASEIVVITREPHSDDDPMMEVRKHLEVIRQQGLNGTSIPLTHVEKATPSSMHSFHELMPYLEGEPFVLTTVDTIFREEEFEEYIRTFRETDCDGLMGVTDYIDDEKPLYVATDDSMAITAFLDRDPDKTYRYISGGIYGLKSQALHTLDRCMREGQSRMRNFQRGLIADGLRLKAHAFGKVFDIDHAQDIKKAAVFLKERITE